MNKYSHSTKPSGPYFEGWYIKLQAPSGTSLALIPALHIEQTGQRSASLQIITADRTWYLEYPAAGFSACRDPFQASIGQSIFHTQGLLLDIQRDDLSLHGDVRFDALMPLKSDIMGPFRFLPAMECVHGVISMGHALSGSLTLCGEAIDFTDGTGYIETDRGCSFPSRYLWTQCAWREHQQNGLMLSIATIPLPIGHFTGCICAVLYGGQEYRLATYRGVRIERWSSGGAVIRQGKLRLEAELLEEQARPLRAPVKGNMVRTVHESVCAKVRYRFYIGEQLLFDHTDSGAGFEYADK